MSRRLDFSNVEMQKTHDCERDVVSPVRLHGRIGVRSCEIAESEGTHQLAMIIFE